MSISHTENEAKESYLDELYKKKLDLPDDFPTALGLDKKAGPVSVLHFFDFDQTLVRTPNPDEGKKIFEQKTGSKWTGGWWGRSESLRPPVLESPCPSSRIIRTTVTELLEIVRSSQTSVAVVATGRIKPLRGDVLRILEEVAGSCSDESNGESKFILHPSSVFTHPGGGLSTLEFKKLLIYTMLSKAPLSSCSITELHIWEDRQPHAEEFATSFATFLRERFSVETFVHLVPPEAP